MKKIIAISLVAIMAVSSVFAAISGSVTTSAGFNLDSKEYGFFDLDKTSGKLVLDLYADTKDTTPVAVEATEETEAVEVPSVYAYVKANLAIKATISADKLGETAENIDSSSKTYYATDVNGNFVKKDGTIVEKKDAATKSVASNNPYFDFNLVEAGVVGENWSLSILGTPSAPSFAKGFLDLDEDDEIDDIYEVPYFAANGLKATVYGYTIGAGLHGKKGEGTSATGYIQTPDYDFGVDGLAVAAAATYSHRAPLDDVTTSKVGFGQYYSVKEVKNNGKTVVLSNDNWEYKPVDSKVDSHNLSFSGKVGYATDLVSATVSTDLGVKNLKTTRAFGIDVATNVTYDFVTFDAYYGYKNRLDLQVAADLNKWAPVTLKLGLADIATSSRNLYGEVGAAVASFEGKLTGNVDLKANPGWELGAEASYDVENIAKFAISTSINEKSYWGMSISAENTTLIPGATLSLGWYDAADLLRKNNGLKFEDKVYVADKYYEVGTDLAADEVEGLIANHSDFGVIKASLSIAF